MIFQYILLACALLFFLTSLCFPIFFKWAQRQPKSDARMRVAVVLGSGGHTSELLSMIKEFDFVNKCRLALVIADTDKNSIGAFKARYPELVNDTEVYIIPRSREVGQSYFTSIFTTLKAFATCAAMVNKLNSDLLLTNGPGTCLPVIVLSALRGLMSPLNRSRIVFVESFCRTQQLSFTGKIVYKLRLADEFVVHWEALKQKYPRTKFLGVLL